MDDDIFAKLNEPAEKTWVLDEYCAKLLKNIDESDPDRDDLVVAVRHVLLNLFNFDRISIETLEPLKRSPPIGKQYWFR